MRGTGKREKHAEYNKRIVDIAGMRLSEVIIGAHVNYTYSVDGGKNTLEYLRLYEYLSGIEKLTDYEIRSRLLIDEKEKKDPLYIKHKIRNTVAPQKKILVKGAFSRQIKKIDDPKLKQQMAMIIEEYARQKPKKKVVRKPAKPEPKNPLYSLSVELDKRVTDVLVARWRELFKDEHLLEGSIRACDASVAILIRKLPLYLLPLKISCYSVSVRSFGKLPEGSKDKAIEYVSRQVFPKGIDNWNDAYRHLTNYIIDREKNADNYKEHASNRDYFEHLFGTDFAYSANRNKALAGIEKHWRKVQDRNFPKWKVSDTEIAKYKAVEEEYYAEAKARSQAEAGKRVAAYQKFPEVKQLLEEIGKNERKIEKDLAGNRQLVEGYIKSFNRIGKKYQDDPDWHYIAAVKQELQRLLDRPSPGKE